MLPYILGTIIAIIGWPFFLTAYMAVRGDKTSSLRHHIRYLNLFLIILLMIWGMLGLNYGIAFGACYFAASVISTMVSLAFFLDIGMHHGWVSLRR